MSDLNEWSPTSAIGSSIKSMFTGQKASDIAASNMFVQKFYSRIVTDLGAAIKGGIVDPANPALAGVAQPKETQKETPQTEPSVTDPVPTTPPAKPKRKRAPVQKQPTLDWPEIDKLNESLNTLYEQRMVEAQYPHAQSISEYLYDYVRNYMKDLDIQQYLPQLVRGAVSVQQNWKSNRKQALQTFGNMVYAIVKQAPKRGERQSAPMARPQSQPPQAPQRPVQQPEISEYGKHIISAISGAKSNNPTEYEEMIKVAAKKLELLDYNALNMLLQQLTKH